MALSQIDRDYLAIRLAPKLKASASPSEELIDLLLANNDAGTKPLVIFDEVVHLQHACPDVFGWLRDLGQRGITVVYAGSHYDWYQVVEVAMRQPGSSFGNDVEAVDVGPLKTEQAEEFLLSTAPQELDLRNPQIKVVDWIIERCGGWPFYLQVMGSALVGAHNDGLRGPFINRDDLHDLYCQRLLQDRGDAFRSRWSDTPASARSVLLTMEGRSLPAASTVAPAHRNVLRNCGLLNIRNEWLHDPPFLDWIRLFRDELAASETEVAS